MKQLVAASLILLLAVASQAKEDVAPQPLAIPAHAGMPDNGLQMEIDVPEQWYVLGDGIQIPLSFKNTTADALSVSIDKCCSFYDRVFLIDLNGIPCAASQERSRRKHMGPMWLDVPAKGETKLPQALTHWVNIEKPGTYTLWIEFAAKKMEPKELENAWRKPTGTPWHGKIASNAVKIRVISQEEFARRAGGMLKTPPYDGFSVSLSAKAAVCKLGEAPQLVAELKNAETRALSVPWATHYRVTRLTPEGGAIAINEFVYRTAKDPVPLIELPAGEKQSIELKLRDDHVQQALAGKVRYRVDFWVPASVEIDSDPPVAPIRTVSNEIEISYEIDEAALDRLLPLAAVEAQQRQRGWQARNLTVLTSYLEQVGPWLPARIKDRATPDQRLASDLDVAFKLKQAAKLQPRYDPKHGIYVDARGARLEPAAFAELGGMANPIANPGEFARQLVQLRFCADLARVQIPTNVFIAPETPADMFQHLAREITREAAARNVYIYRLDIVDDNAKRSLQFQDEASYSLLIGVSTIGGKLRYNAHIFPKRDARPTYYNGWETKDLPAAVAELATSPHQFNDAAGLANFLAAREKRHEQIWILPSGNVTWNDVAAAASAVRSWQEHMSVSIATTLPAPPKDAPPPRVAAPAPQPVPPPAKPDDF